MKVTINRIDDQSEFPTIRKLIYVDSDAVTIVLFTSETRGVVLASSNPGYDVGSTHHRFVSCFNANTWARTSVTLES